MWSWSSVAGWFFECEARGHVEPDRGRSDLAVHAAGRYALDGLSARVRRHLGEDPTSGHWFVFINRRRSLLKILAFDTDGYWIWSKRLEQGQFGPHGGAKEGKRILSRTDLLALLEGIDMQIIRQRKRYRKTT